jgi:hypothetical protein
VSVAVQDALGGSPVNPSSLGEARSLSSADSAVLGGICLVEQRGYQSACGNTTLKGDIANLGGTISNVGSYASDGIAAELIA